ncbi:MAG: hypothetical protein IBJ15_04985 [Alphaproteobacteria bacterium]|nr:hypothetical protein [Alphaproteobacteria bacterium]
MIAQFLTALFPFALLFVAGYIGHQASKLALRFAVKMLPEGRGLAAAPYALFATYACAGAAALVWAAKDPAIVWAYPIPFVALTAAIAGAMAQLGVSCAKISQAERMIKRAMAERSDGNR